MRVKVTMSTIWESNHPADKETMEVLVKNKPTDICLDYLTDAVVGGDSQLSAPEVAVEFMSN